jgi:hypothetical protein
MAQLPIAEHQSIAAWRKAVSAFGVKPTQHRAVPEALLRRLTNAGAIPLINTLVDIGNEVGGIRLPDVAAPIGVHTGWNVRHPDTGSAHDETFLLGSTWWFDELPTLEDHLAASGHVIDQLIERRLILRRDADRLVADAQARSNAAQASR